MLLFLFEINKYRKRLFDLGSILTIIQEFKPETFIIKWNVFILAERRERKKQLTDQCFSSDDFWYASRETTYKLMHTIFWVFFQNLYSHFFHIKQKIKSFAL